MNNKTLINLLPLKTDRLTIKKTTINDIDLLLRIDKQEITQAFLGRIKNKTKEERIEFLKNKENKSNSLTVYLNDIKIGFINIDIIDNNAELSYIFDCDYTNKGYCTEACKKLIEVLFNNIRINSISADIVKGNNSSKRVLEKLGFEYQNETIKDDIIFLNYIIYNK